MTISSYQVDNVIKAYTKQTKVKIKSDITIESAKGIYKDVVSLSTKGSAKEDAYEKISYNLMDIILKNGVR
jgi:phosphotransferase system HPr-like phosphotransfer protein